MLSHCAFTLTGRGQRPPNNSQGGKGGGGLLPVRTLVLLVF